MRVKKTVGSTTTEYLLNRGSVVKELTGGVTTHLLQSPLTHQPLKRGNRWFIPDQLGSAALLTDEAGTTVQSYGYL